MKRDFSYNEIDSLVNSFSEEEFSMLKEAVNERNLEEYGVGIGEIDPNNRVIDNEEVIINGHTYLYGQKQIDYIMDEIKEEGLPEQAFVMVKKNNGHGELNITSGSRKACADALLR